MQQINTAKASSQADGSSESFEETEMNMNGFFADNSDSVSQW